MKQPTALEASKSPMNDSQIMAQKRAQAKEALNAEEAAESLAASFKMNKASDIAKNHSNKKQRPPTGA